MSEFKYPNLFSPLTLRGAVFRNRIFAAPSGYRLNKPDSICPEEGFQYYRRKAMGGAASVATGQLIVDSEYGLGHSRDICIDSPFVEIPLGKFAYSIARYGAVPTAELSHAGMYANSESNVLDTGKGRGGMAYGPVDMDLHGRQIKEMPEEMIEKTIGKFVNGALIAKRCGFGMILLHAGHGWFFHQWLSPSVNTRKDKWGGPDIENRARITVSVCDAIRKAVGPAMPIEVRMSGFEGYDGGYTVEDGIAFAKQLEGHVDLIQVSAGNHEVREVFPVMTPGMFQNDGHIVWLAETIKKQVGTRVATIGSLGDPEMLEDIIASGKADVVEMCKSLIADPDLPNKIRTGREPEIKVCLRCMNCYSNQQLHGVKYCSVNPESGHEHETVYNMRQDAARKKVLVVGGGIAGVEAALTCSKYGHKVILCEKTGRLGGTLRCEENVPFKRRLEKYLDNQEYAIRNSDIDLRLNTEVTPKYAEAIGPDVIVAALGARPFKPPIPGIDGKNVLGAEEAYLNPDKVGKSAVILGGGLVGDELAIYLRMLGRNVEIVEMLDSINDGGNFIHTIGMTLEMERLGLNINFSTKAVEITEEGVRCENPGGEKIFKADTVIYAVGQKPLREEAYSLRYCAPEFYTVGDCITPKNIPNATGPAHDIAINIGRY